MTNQEKINQAFKDCDKLKDDVLFLKYQMQHKQDLYEATLAYMQSMCKVHGLEVTVDAGSCS